MCTRYENDAAPAAVADRFGLKDLPGSQPSPQHRPTDQGLTIEQGNRASIRRWGLKVSWNKQPVINARAETLTDKPTFMTLLENRCLVPASAYFEWRQEGAKRLKNRISLADDGLFALAGLLSGDCFTIITCEPLPAIAHIHNRMPVILERRAEADWINPDIPFEAVRKWLRPYGGNMLHAVEDTPPPERQADLFG